MTAPGAALLVVAALGFRAPWPPQPQPLGLRRALTPQCSAAGRFLRERFGCDEAESEKAAGRLLPNMREGLVIAIAVGDSLCTCR